MTISSLYVGITITSAILSTIFAILAWRQRPGLGATLSSLLNTATAIWCASGAAEMAAQTASAKRAWVDVEYLGITTIPILWTLLALHFSGRLPRIRPKLIIACFTVSFFTILICWTNSWHHLLHTHIDVVWEGGAPILALRYGPWIWIHTIWSHGVSFIGTLAIAQVAFTGHTKYRKRSIILFLSSILPVVANVRYLLRIEPYKYLDFTPVALIVTGLACLIVIKFQNLWVMGPLPKDILFRVMGEGIVVLDNLDRLVDLNPAACTLLAINPDKVLGLPLSSAVPGLASVHDELRCHNTHIVSATFRRDDNRELHLEVRHSPIIDAQLDDGPIGCILVMTDSTQRTILESQLVQMAYHDELTTLYNRRAFVEKVEGFLADVRRGNLDVYEGRLSRTDRGQRKAVLALLDLDDFKTINDTLGHLCGDEVLREVSKRLQSICIEPDVSFCARLGGDEFAVFSESSEWTSNPLSLGECIRDILKTPIILKGKPMGLSASIGLAVFPGDGRDFDSLLATADVALYRVKAGGGQGHETATSSTSHQD